ncbi:uncharacterized protein [Rutidosis leptorrhynchoides]|uniref:uncharacterized protein n=1 Tax=Rutidosis leptorrhynchoides TaxID=125765 RepID=UPI003A98EFBF
MKLINKLKSNNPKTECDAKGPVPCEKIVKSNEACSVNCVLRQGVAEVLSLKSILEISTRNEEFVSALVKLENMKLTLNTLEETGIGKTVRALEKHESKTVSEISRSLVKGWRCLVDEYCKKESNVNTEKSNSQKSVVVIHDPQSKEMHSKAAVIQQKVEATKIKLQKPKHNIQIEKEKSANSKTKKRLNGRNILLMEKKSIPLFKRQQSVVKPKMVSVSVESKLQSPNKSTSQPSSQVSFQHVVPKTIDRRSFEEKLVATKRKLQEGYEKARNMKKRRVQTLEVYDVLGQGLAPKYENDKSCKRISLHR